MWSRTSTPTTRASRSRSSPAIDDAIDVESFNVEGDREKEDAAFLDGVRRIVEKTLESIPELLDK